MREDVAGVVLAYRPEPEILENIRLLRQQVGTVFVVDNGASASSEALLAQLGADGVRVLAQAENLGVAEGFNVGMRAALDAGAELVWIFDQDSSVTPGALDALLRTATAGPRVGVVGPALRSHATGEVYRRESGTGSRREDVLISSGALFRRDLLERIGLHDGPLFIDYVDHDICLRARAAGYENRKVFDALIDHRFGDSDPVTFLGRRVYRAGYSPLRQYYAARNRLIVIRRWGGGRWLWEDAWFTAKAWVKVLLLEKDRPAKIRAALRGLADGMRYPVARTRRVRGKDS
ncbi:MAG: glycosyltransferase family 2 protein [Microbacterium sp.]